ncbi:MAG: hypothetical protein JO184_17440 [Gammaproteobacteria bacterium]|nr:hypothetical protein [Gammaproteobacteria bacterium]
MTSSLEWTSLRDAPFCHAPFTETSAHPHSQAVRTNTLNAVTDRRISLFWGGCGVRITVLVDEGA